MNFGKFFFIFAIVLLALAGQGESHFHLKHALKKVEHAARHIRDGILKGVGVVNAVADANNKIHGH